MSPNNTRAAKGRINKAIARLVMAAIVLPFSFGCADMPKFLKLEPYDKKEQRERGRE